MCFVRRRSKIIIKKYPVNSESSGFKMRQKFILSYLLWINILFASAVRKGFAQRINPNPYHGNRNVIDVPDLREQCAMEDTLLPDPETLCCGRNLSHTVKSTGGTGTELDQFPWSVLIRTGFAGLTNDNALSVFSCGGSLISHRYVLTAAHCVFRPGDTLDSLDITLTEYDENCDEMGRNSNCVDELLLQAENVVPHPFFHEEKLRHDIALIRLKEYAPKRYITPVCLPKFNIDHMDLANLQLVVAGWGRNGGHVNNIKERTIVHLVSHEECHRFYQYLKISQICAAGRMGEDTRRGDSGGPLMMKFEGSYYVIGVVSGGARSLNKDTGVTMPSLYTNVFHYIHWIRHNIIRDLHS